MTAWRYVKPLEDLRRNHLPLAGGKGANLGEMIQAGLPVPGGFVVLTPAYRAFIEVNKLQAQIERISRTLVPDDFKAVDVASTSIKELLTQGDLPDDIAREIGLMYERMKDGPVAVRSSGTAEDLPGMSFAGQYDTYLNVTGAEEVCRAVKWCWSSLWNARALSYRLKQGMSPADPAQGVVVQRLVDGDRFGILFTAHPVTGRRDRMLLNASWGLGEAIVSGEVSPDQWVVSKESGEIVEARLFRKELMTVKSDRGTSLVEVPAALRETPVLNESEIARLVEVGRRAEAHFGAPQDLEWVLADDQVYVVQTRPITSLFPLPAPAPVAGGGLRVYVSFNIFAQSMEEPFTLMGEEIFRLLFAGFVAVATGNYQVKYPWWFKTGAGRIYVDLTELLRQRTFWPRVAGFIAQKDAVTARALLEVLERNEGEILKRGRLRIPLRLIVVFLRVLSALAYGMLSPAGVRKKAHETGSREIDRLREEAARLKGIQDKLRFMERKVVEIAVATWKQAFYMSFGLGAIEIAEKLARRWLGEAPSFHLIKQSLPHNPTTEMGMELLRVAEKLKARGKKPAADDPGVQHFLAQYGHRCPLEIDVGVPRWQEDPAHVLDLLCIHLERGNPSDKIRRFHEGMERAEEAVEEIISRVRRKKGMIPARIMRHLLRQFRQVAGLCELPKSDLARAFTLFRRILRGIGEQLVSQGRLACADEVFFVRFKDIESGEDLREVARRNREDYARELKRRSPPRVMTSTGESVYFAAAEEGDRALAGTAVSAGVYEGTVRVVFDPQGATLQPGEILVARGTNPAWTPLFLNAGALITVFPR